MDVRKYVFAGIFTALAMLLAGAASARTPPVVVRGVDFYYLDGSGNRYATPKVESQGFAWVLDHQYDPDVRARIDSLFAKYRAAKVNWIRLLVAADNLHSDDVEPLPTPELIQKLNDFVAITRSGLNAGKFHVEIVLVPGSGFQDIDHDKQWLKAWLDNINYSNVGMVLLGGDLSPCLLSGCEGDAGASATAIRHGAWIKQIWAWKEANYPNLNASYEVIAVQSASNNNPALIAKLANWSDANTPGNEVLAVSMYVSLAPGSTWQQYATATNAILDAYSAASSKPLWIDEFGKSRGTDTGGTTWTLQDQRNAYQGVLGATFCQRTVTYATFAWVAGRDYPYDYDSTGRARYNGLVEVWNGSTPTMSATWNDLSLYYRLTTCP